MTRRLERERERAERRAAQMERQAELTEQEAEQMEQRAERAEQDAERWDQAWDRDDCEWCGAPADASGLCVDCRARWDRDRRLAFPAGSTRRLRPTSEQERDQWLAVAIMFGILIWLVFG